MIREGLQKSSGRGHLKAKLSKVLEVYNEVTHSATGVSPNEALRPEFWHEMRRRQLEGRSTTLRQHARKAHLEKFFVGQKVLVQQDIVTDKQKPKYNRGGIVLEDLGHDTYNVRFKSQVQKRHACQLKAEEYFDPGML